MMISLPTGVKNSPMDDPDTIVLHYGSSRIYPAKPNSTVVQFDAMNQWLVKTKK